MSKEPAKRKIIDNAGYPLVRLPIKLFRDLALTFGQEVYVEKVLGETPFSWEIRIKPIPLKQTAETPNHHSHEKHDPHANHKHYHHR